MNGRLDREQSLVLSRRVDWRFLLPDPSLEHVAYVGDNTDHLLESLQAFSGVTDVLSDRDLDDAPRQGHYDVIVLQGATSIDGRHRALLKRQGCIYVEVTRSRIHPLHKRGMNAAAFARAATTAGFADVQINWHWPAFENCTRIVPLDNEAPLGFLFSGGERDFKARMAWTGAKLLVRGGVLSRSAACFSLIARAS